MIDRRHFFDCVRRPFGHLSQSQVEGCERIISEAEKREIEPRWLAYILATVFWETARAMQPVTEAGSPHYLQSKRYWPWIGRGLVQITWRKNYENFRSRVLAEFKRDLLKDPKAALDPDIAVFIAFEGMINGEFTGYRLSDYFDGNREEWKEARRIINGLDHAEEIARIAREFNTAIRKESK